MLVPSPDELYGITDVDLIRLCIWIAAMLAIVGRILINDLIISKYRKRLEEMGKVVHKLIARQKEMDEWQTNITAHIIKVERMNDKYRKYLYREQQRSRERQGRK